MVAEENTGRRQDLSWSRLSEAVLARKALENILIPAEGCEQEEVGTVGLCMDTAIEPTLVHKHVPERYVLSVATESHLLIRYGAHYLKMGSQ